MATEIKYIANNKENGVSSKLLTDQFNVSEVIKSVDIDVNELIPNQKAKNLNLILKSIYLEQIEANNALSLQIENTKKELEIIKIKIFEYNIIVKKLLEINDLNKLKEARSDNYLDSLQNIIIDLKQNNVSILSKVVIEKTEKNTIDSENQGLIAQKNALIKQINILNNLLAQAQKSLARARQELSAKEQINGAPIGELATIIFDNGDVTKTTTEAMVMLDLNGGPNFKRSSPQNIYVPVGGGEKAFSKWFEITAAYDKDIEIEVQFAGDLLGNPFNFYGRANIEKNATKRFDITTASAFMTRQPGRFKKSWLPFSGYSPTKYTFSMMVKVNSGAEEAISPEISFIIYNYT